MSKLLPHERVAAAEAILRTSHTPEALSICLDDWDEFVPYPQPRVGDSEDVYEYLWGCYTQLRQHAFEWLTDYRLLNLAARVEALERDRSFSD